MVFDVIVLLGFAVAVGIVGLVICVFLIIDGRKKRNNLSNT